MRTFNYKDKIVEVYNDGGRIPAPFQEYDETPEPITHIAGNRIEFEHGGGRWMYQVLGLNYDETIGYNRVHAQALFLNPIGDGTFEVIQKKDASYSVDVKHFEMLSTFPSLPGSTMLQTQAMHMLNGLLARIPQLGGDQYGRGLEFFNNDGTVRTPLFAYRRYESAEGVDIEVAPVTLTAFRLTVDGDEYLEEVVTEEATYDEEGNLLTPAVTELQQSLRVRNLIEGFHEFIYEQLDETGQVAASQTRLLLV